MKWIKRRPSLFLTKQNLANYADKVLDLVEHLGPGVHPVRVSHDDWCRLLRGLGECNCNPDVSLMATEENEPKD